MLTPKQQKLIELIIVNYGQKGVTKTMKEMMLEAGYSESSSTNPQLILNEEVMDKITPVITKMEEIRTRALNSITQEKLDDASPRDIAYVADIMTKNSQLLSGGDTEKINIPIQISEIIAKKNKLNDSDTSTE